MVIVVATLSLWTDRNASRFGLDLRLSRCRCPAIMMRHCRIVNNETDSEASRVLGWERDGETRLGPGLESLNCEQSPSARHHETLVIEGRCQHRETLLVQPSERVADCAGDGKTAALLSMRKRRQFHKCPGFSSVVGSAILGPHDEGGCDDRNRHSHDESRASNSGHTTSTSAS